MKEISIDELQNYWLTKYHNTNVNDILLKHPEEAKTSKWYDLFPVTQTKAASPHHREAAFACSIILISCKSPCAIQSECKPATPAASPRCGRQAGYSSSARGAGRHNTATALRAFPVR